MYTKLPGIVMYNAQYKNVNTLVNTPVVTVTTKSALSTDFERRAMTDRRVYSKPHIATAMTMSVMALKLATAATQYLDL
jgi:hypothetical protein